LAVQGAGAALLTRVSDDAVGRYCQAELARYGVDTRYVTLAQGGVRTSLAVTETRATDCQVVLYRNDAADFAFSQSDAQAVDFTTTSALIVTGTALAKEPSRSACFLAIARAKQAGSIVVLDVDYRAYSWESRTEAAEVCLQAAHQCDIVIGNDEEFGLMSESLSQGQALAQRLGQAGLFAIYKMGPLGCVTYTPDYAFTTGIFPVNAIKPMGAGDGFMGGLMAGLAQGHLLDSAVRRGAATAAIIVSGVGCAPASPNKATLDAFLAR
jgi:5-dehydro-2-deoxygluconokinase